MRTHSALVALVAGLSLISSHAQTSQRLEIDRSGETIVLEPYAPNVVRVTLSLQAEAAKGKPGYGFVASADASGWTKNQTNSADVYQSDQLLVSVDRPQPSSEPPVRSEGHIGNFFGGTTPGAHITFRTPEGKTLLEMTGWSQAVPNHKDGTADLA